MEENIVVWTPRSKLPFKVKIVEVTDDKSELHIYKKGKVRTRDTKRFLEDSESDEDEPPAKKQPSDEIVENIEQDEDISKQEEHNFNHPVLSKNGSFRNHMNIYQLNEKSSSQFMESDRALLKKVLKTQEDLSIRLDKLYMMMKYLVSNKQEPGHNKTNNTVSTTSVQNFEEKEVNGKENDINEDKFVLENGVHLLRVHGKDPCKYVLSLIDVLFSKEEWQNVAI